MWRLTALAVVQSLLLCAAQVLLKTALTRMPPFALSGSYLQSALTSWPLAASGLAFAASSLLWMHMVKHYPLSTAYPMVSLSYVFGMLAAIIFFHEHVSPTKWAGLLLIVAGCYLIAKQ